MTSRNKKDLQILKKYELETFGLLAKGDLVVMICVAHNRTSRLICDILKERHAIAKNDLDRSFHPKYF